MPFGAFSFCSSTPSTSSVDASLISFRSNVALPSSYTHWSRPSLFLKITNATVPISRIVCTAPLTFTASPVFAFKSSVISNVSFFFTPVWYSMTVSLLLNFVPYYYFFNNFLSESIFLNAKKPGIHNRIPGRIILISAVPPAFELVFEFISRT